MKRRTLVVLSVVSCLLSVAASVLWVRGRSGVDEAALRHDRYLDDRSDAADAIYLTSDHRLWLSVHTGSVGPYDGRLVWGYHINANQSGSKPRWFYDRSPYKTSLFASDGRSPIPDQEMSGWGPLRWQIYRRSGNGEQSRSITFGVSHWLVAIAFLLCSLIYAALARRRRPAVVENGCQREGPHGSEFDAERATPRAVGLT